MERDSEGVKAWLTARVGKTIAAMVVHKEVPNQAEHIEWRGKAKVLRCVEQGVVLELHGGPSTTSFGGVFHFFRNIFLKHVVSPWPRGRISIPYEDLQVVWDPHTGEQWLSIDAATWKRAPEELRGDSQNAKGDCGTETD